RALLSALPAHHPATQWMARTGETGAREAHLVDAFLPAREATFTADGVLALVEAAGLAFQGWLARGPYEPDGLFPLGHPLGEAFAALPDAERFAAMAALTVPLDHWFLACRRDRDPARYQLDFGAADLLDWVPGRRFPPAPRHPPLPYDPRDPVQEALYRPIDGQRRLGECLAAAGLSGPPAAMHDAVRRFIAHLWRKDAVFLRLPRRSP
ncbi:MAG: hypothetical protein KC620_07495, partial [Myxococcales bacterium]|nr:hypothetical protein [Myxococcales bacterium]